MARIMSRSGRRTAWDDSNQCTVCHEQRRYLKHLPCCHKFCEFCLQKLMLQHNYQAFPCPMCRALTPVPDSGASGYPIHFADAADAEVARAARDALTQQRPECSRCKAGDATKMLFTCAECAVVICFWCHDDHLDKRHTLILLQAGDGEDAFRGSLGRRSLHSTECWEHGGNRLTHICKSCSVLVCQVCVGLTHAKHKTEPVEEAAVPAREKLKEVKECLKPLQGPLKWLRQNVLSSLHGLDDEVSLTELQIELQAEQLKNIVDKAMRDAKAALKVAALDLKRTYLQDLRNVETRLVAVLAKEKHVDGLLQSGCDQSAVRMKASAELNVRRRHLKRFTDRLPLEVLRIEHHSDMPVESATKTIEQFVGSHRFEKGKRRIPAVDNDGNEIPKEKPQ